VLTKFQNDIYTSNKELAFACGIDPQELNELEVYTLALLDFQLFVSEEDFKNFD
jgi:hypothetical protein